jgi:ubiquinol-cytochrome c reductase cytochrome b subunit
VGERRIVSIIILWGGFYIWFIINITIKLRIKLRFRQKIIRVILVTKVVGLNVSPRSNHLVTYPTPRNFSYVYSFGSLRGLFFVVQVRTGLMRICYYQPSISGAFNSVEIIRREREYGWLIRYRHSNGASFIFRIVYRHIRRTIVLKSFIFRLNVWMSGIRIFLVMIRTAFLGYVLPWGQRSYWGATVITSLFSAVPIIGSTLTEWLWGGFVVSQATLGRFFMLHVVLPILLGGLIRVHIMLLHETGSSNSVGLEGDSVDCVTFYPYFFVKDMFIGVVVLIVFFFFVCFCPNFLGHTDNYIIRNSLVTPTHIVPEWYFLSFYGILRLVPQKLGGVILIVFSIVGFLGIRILTNYRLYKSHKFIFISNRLSILDTIGHRVTWGFMRTCFLLGWIGAQAREEPFLCYGKVLRIMYFSIISGIRILNYLVYFYGGDKAAE